MEEGGMLSSGWLDCARRGELLPGLAHSSTGEAGVRR